MFKNPITSGPYNQSETSWDNSPGGNPIPLVQAQIIWYRLGMSSELRIDYLAGGGIITTYRCTARCAHCLYAASPAREKAYLDQETLAALIKTLHRMGCPSVHIGGGEPLLDPPGLLRTVEGLAAGGIGIEYVETNCAWYRDYTSTVSLFRELRSAGLDTLLISISPFHNASIPFAKTKGVLAACRAVGMQAFPWIAGFVRDLEAFDEDRPHSLPEYAERFGPDYLRSIPSRMWVHMGGRAADTFAQVLPNRCAEDIVRVQGGPCRELADTSHFHLDYDGNYIPGLCAGLAIRHTDLGRPLAPQTYPLVTLLSTRGVGGLLQLAREAHGFVPRPGYVHKCHLCQDIRRHLVERNGNTYPELAPLAFYAEI